MMTPQRVLQAIFATTSVMATIYIAIALYLGPGEISPLPPPARAPNPVLHMKNPVHLESVESYAEIVERPLFSPTRRPLRNPILAKNGAKGPLNQDIVLTGVIIRGGDKLALLKARNSPKEEGVKEGEIINGWQVDKILPDRVLLTAAGKTAVIPIWDARKAAAAKAAAGKPATRRGGERDRKLSADKSVPRIRAAQKKSTNR